MDTRLLGHHQANHQDTATVAAELPELIAAIAANPQVPHLQFPIEAVTGVRRRFDVVLSLICICQPAKRWYASLLHIAPAIIAKVHHRCVWQSLQVRAVHSSMILVGWHGVEPFPAGRGFTGRLPEPLALPSQTGAAPQNRTVVSPIPTACTRHCASAAWRSLEASNL